MDKNINEDILELDIIKLDEEDFESDFIDLGDEITLIQTYDEYFEEDETVETEVIEDTSTEERDYQKYLMDTVYIYFKAINFEAASNYREYIRKPLNTNYETSAITKDIDMKTVQVIYNDYVKGIMDKIVVDKKYNSMKEKREELDEVFTIFYTAIYEAYLAGIEIDSSVDVFGKYRYYAENLTETGDYTTPVRREVAAAFAYSLVQKGMRPVEALVVFRKMMKGEEEREKEIKMADIASKELYDCIKLMRTVMKIDSKTASSLKDVLVIDDLIDKYFVRYENENCDRLALCGTLYPSNGKVLAECDCGRILDMTDSIKVFSMAGYNSNSQISYYKVRPVICEHCGRINLIPKSTLRGLCYFMLEQTRDGLKIAGSKNESRLNYMALLYISTVLKNSGVTIESEDSEEENDYRYSSEYLIENAIKMFKELDEQYKEYDGSDKSVALYLMSRNGTRITIPKICGYVCKNLSVSAKKICDRAYKDNMKRTVKYIEYSIAREILELQDIVYGVKSTLSVEKKAHKELLGIQEVDTPLKELSSGDKKTIIATILEILTDEVLSITVNNIEVDNDLSMYIHFSRLGILVEEVLKLDKTNDLLLRIFKSFMEIKLHEDRTVLYTPQVIPIASKDKKIILKEVTNAVAVSPLGILDRLGVDISLYNNNIADEYDKFNKSVYKDIPIVVDNYSEGVVWGTLNYMQYLREPEKMLSKGIGIETTSEFDMSTGKTVEDKEEVLDMNMRQIVLIATLRAFDKERWVRQDMYTILKEKFTEYI